jgi:hypothetical protein
MRLSGCGQKRGRICGKRRNSGSPGEILFTRSGRAFHCDACACRSKHARLDWSAMRLFLAELIEDGHLASAVLPDVDEFNNYKGDADAHHSHAERNGAKDLVHGRLGLNVNGHTANDL